KGSGFTGWGAVLGVGFDLTPEGYDALGVGGLQFWMKNTTPISVGVSTKQTTPIRDGGDCIESADEGNCYNSFGFAITALSPDWTEYKVPFNALRQRAGGSAIWNPRHLTNILFDIADGAEFDVSVDDLSFYDCGNSECQPTCRDPDFPVSCREGVGFHSSCQPPGTDCNAVVDRGMLDPALVAMGGGDPACVGLPSEQLPRCFLETPTGIPFATRVNPYTEGLSNARLRNPEPGKVCMKGTLAEGGAAAISPILSPIEFDFPPLVSAPFDLQALDIEAIEFTITHPPEGGVSLELRGLTQDECSPGFYCLGPVFSLGGPNARVFEDRTVRAKISEFEPADPGPRHVLSLYFWGHNLPPYDTNYDFCLSDVKFFNSLGELVTPPPAGGG
ncbi:MAG TPA: hypothetical protein VJU61_19105, partial [Polyangiaceae bacterium]|nr:hypothetical protein [Polyangiaceae bacterium]